ncbi:uncharacterized protein [Channa argus]|uniref:uncharacterized protein isoform X13 n=1 Tax=Channa argus TaxID=215402 RepID=UPI0035224743
MLKLDQLSQSWHLIGHRVSMTWRILTTLFLFGLLVNLSMQACGDYFSASEWKVNYLKENVTLAKAKQPKDFLNCTVLYESKKSNYFYNILDLCLQNNITEEMCDGETSQKLSFFNFMCILARSLDFADVDLKETGCQYSEYTENGENKSICQMHSDLLPFVSNRPEKIQEQKDDLKTKTMQYCLMVSLALNVILPLAVYLRMRKMPPDRSQRENNGSSQGSQQIIVLQPVTHLEFENRDQVENIQLLEGSSQWIILFCLTLSSVSSCVPPTPLMLCFTASMNHLLGLCLLLLSGNFILNIRLPMCSASILCTCPNLLQTVLILFFFPFSPPELSLCTAKEKERNFRRHCTQISSTQGSCSIRPKNRIQSALALVT